MNGKWQDLHNDSFDDDNTGSDKREVEICVDENISYRCFVEVHTYRNFPCDGEVVSMFREVYIDLNLVSTMELYQQDFPHYIMNKAIQEAMGVNDAF